MNIFILEDDVVQQSRIEEVVVDLVAQHHLSVKRLEVFGKPEQLLAAVAEKGRHQLFFLDIEIREEEKRGLEVAREIRQLDPYALIVFVTTHSEWMPLAFRYQVSALDYIAKDLPSAEWLARIEKVLLYADEQVTKTVAEDAFYYQSKYAQIQVPFQDILYLETSPRPHRVILYTEKDRTEFTASLTEILQQESRLLACHRSFVVNPANVVKIDKHEKILYFRNGSSCLIARSKLETVLATIEQLHEGSGL
ncbi:response regulator transcription factor [Streptococcus sp. ZJ93]|uniref:response regulator transcription factor n=1 Tax=Streptococcus handemini TaxID=3161188 RepID=UPI0034D695CA